MTEEEKKAIEWLKYEIDEAHRELEKCRNDEHKGYGTAEDVAKLVYCNRHNLLNLIQKQDTEINKLNTALKACEKSLIEERTERIKLNNVIDKLVNELRYQVGMGQQDMFCYDICENKEKRECTDEECRNCIKEYFMKEE